MQPNGVGPTNPPQVSLQKCWIFFLGGPAILRNFEDEKLYLQFAVSTLVPLWRPQRYSSHTEHFIFPPVIAEPKKVILVWAAVLCSALSGKWRSAQ